MAEQIISREEYEKYFKNDSMYGQTEPKWPKETIVLYQYSIIPSAGNEINLWKRGDSVGSHAEINMLRDLREQLKDVNNQDAATLVLKIYASYSPCSDCSAALITFIGDMKKKFKDVDVEIRFQSFYMFPYAYENGSLNIDFKSNDEEEQCTFPVGAKNRKGFLNLYPNVKTLGTIPDKDFTFEQFLAAIGIPEVVRKVWHVPSKNEVTARWMQQVREYVTDPVPEIGNMRVH